MKCYTCERPESELPGYHKMPSGKRVCCHCVELIGLFTLGIFVTNDVPSKVLELLHEAEEDYQREEALNRN